LTSLSQAGYRRQALSGMTGYVSRGVAMWVGKLLACTRNGPLETDGPQRAVVYPA